MKKHCFKYIFVLFLLYILIVSGKALAITSTGDYTIESYDIEMIVNEDNTFDITENITAYFTEPKHRNF